MSEPFHAELLLIFLSYNFYPTFKEKINSELKRKKKKIRINFEIFFKMYKKIIQDSLVN